MTNLSWTETTPIGARTAEKTTKKTEKNPFIGINLLRCEKYFFFRETTFQGLKRKLIFFTTERVTHEFFSQLKSEGFRENRKNRKKLKKMKNKRRKIDFSPLYPIQFQHFIYQNVSTLRALSNGNGILSWVFWNWTWKRSINIKNCSGLHSFRCFSLMFSINRVCGVCVLNVEG